MKKALSQSEIDTHLAKLSVEWSVIGGTTLMRSITCEDFTQAHKIVNAVAKKRRR